MSGISNINEAVRRQELFISLYKRAFPVVAKYSSDMIQIFAANPRLGHEAKAVYSRFYPCCAQLLPLAPQCILKLKSMHLLKLSEQCSMTLTVIRLGIRLSLKLTGKSKREIPSKSRSSRSAKNKFPVTHAYCWSAIPTLFGAVV